MTAIPAQSAPAAHDDAHAHEHGHEELSFIKKYFFSTDHKIIGIEFLFFGLIFFMVGGLLAMLVRWQLAWPGRPIPWFGIYMGWDGGKMPPDYYNQAFTMHATIMIFFVIIPILVGAFGNYLIPLMIGARDMAFPFLNGMAFWLALPAGAIMVAAFFMPGGTAAAGWTSYPPLSSTFPNGVNYAGRNPYIGTVPYLDANIEYRAAVEAEKTDHSKTARLRVAAAYMGKIAQPFRLRAQGINTFTGVPEATANGLRALFTGNNEELIDASREALLAAGYILEPSPSANVISGTSVTTGGENPAHVTITVADGALTIQADHPADLFRASAAS